MHGGRGRHLDANVPLGVGEGGRHRRTPKVATHQANTLSRSGSLSQSYYRVVQLNLTPEIELFYMLFQRYLSIFSVTSLKQHMEYFHFRC